MRPKLTVLALFAVLALVASACGGEERDTGFPQPGETPPATETPSPTPGGGGGQRVTVTVGDNFFEPKEQTIKVGTTVVWEQTQGSAPHNVVADDNSFNSHPDCSFSDPSKCLNRGQRYERAFEQAGRIPYYCALHGGPGGAGMAGVIIVEAA